jgi:3-oxoacyl-[acyl-carrier protein] reductase
MRALVTGASGAIGAAVSRELAARGLHVIAHAHRNRARLEALTGTLRENGASAEAICFDVGEASACREALTALLAQGPVQVLVNNAGAHCDAPMAGMSEAVWKNMVNVNLNGFYNVTQPLLLPMMRTRWGRIVTVSSIAGLLGNRGQANYAAAKAGLIGASKSLALELASRGITVNVVAPGIIESPMGAAAFDAARIRQLVPMGRAGRPDEVASLVGFLVSEEAAYLSGQTISINGAMT